MIAKETLYLTADRGTVVKEGDPKAQFLLVREGHELNDTLAEKYGVKGDKSPAATNPEATEAAAPPAQKEEPAKAPAKKAPKKAKK
jgi:hypothetical protein